MMGPDEIHIHILRVGTGSSTEPLEGLLSLLPSNEREQYRRFESESRRLEFLLSRLLVRRLLATYLNSEMCDLKFGTRDWGKPFVEASDLQFNLSHKCDLIACSLSRR
jgi:4'-phosphopantetheinyl transferase